MNSDKNSQVFLFIKNISAQRITVKKPAVFIISVAYACKTDGIIFVYFVPEQSILGKIRLKGEDKICKVQVTVFCFN